MKGGESVPEEAKPLSMAALAGGASRTTLSHRDRIYLVVNSLGEPSLTKHGKQKTYEASSPSAAATKSFYAWWRTMQKPKGVKLVSESRPPVRGGDAWDRLQDHLDGMAQRLQGGALERFEHQRAVFENQFARIDPAVLDQRLLVRVSALGGGSSGTPRNYIVQYERNTNPNMLEVVGPSGGSAEKVYQPIVVNAHARYVPKDAPLVAGAGLYFLERELAFMS